MRRGVFCTPYPNIDNSAVVSELTKCAPGRSDTQSARSEAIPRSSWVPSRSSGRSRNCPHRRRIVESFRSLANPASISLSVLADTPARFAKADCDQPRARRAARSRSGKVRRRIFGASKVCMVAGHVAEKKAGPRPHNQYMCQSNEFRNQMVEEALPTVRGIAKSILRRLPRNVAVEDLIQIGMVALIDPAERWDKRRGVPFPLFASSRVRGAMLDAYRYQRFRDTTAVQLDRDERAVEESATLRTLAGEVRRAIDQLGEAERKVITLRYVEDLDRGESAERMGRSRERIRQIEAKAIAHLKEKLAA